MSRYADREELRDKIDWEGGLEEALMYGIKAEDMPEGDEELQREWDRLQDLWNEYYVQSEVVSQLIDY